MPIGVVWRHSCLNRQSVSRDSKVRAPWIPGWQQDVINGSGDEVSIMQSPTTCWKHCRSTWRRVNEEKNEKNCRRHFRPILMWSQFYWRKSQRRHLHPGDQWRCSQVVRPSIQSFIHPSLHPLVHWFMDPLIRWLKGSLNHWLIDSLSHWISRSLIRWFIHWSIDSMNHGWFIDSSTHFTH